MFDSISTRLYNDRTREKVAHLSPFIADRSSVLDFGSGDLSMMRELTQYRSDVKATGVDVVDFGKRLKGIPFKKIDNDSIPYYNTSFDIVISYFVFHHTDDPDYWLKECIRVSKRRIIFVEPIWRVRAEYPLMCAWDTLCNRWKTHDVPLPFSFRSREWWRRKLRQYSLNIVATKDVEPMPAFLPIGRATMFVADKLQ